MRIKLILAVVMVLLSWPAMAQVGTPVTVYDGTTPVSTSHPLPVTGSFSATLSGFTPNLNFATLTASASSGSVALPAGVTVFFQNAGTTTASCTLGIGSATAVANEIQVPANSGVPVTVGSNTFGACIDQTGSASNLIVLAGGSGLGTPFGGGSSGGGSGAITAWGGATLGAATAWGTPPTGNVIGANDNLASMGGTAINSGCVGALSGFSGTIPATICGIYGTYVLNATSPGAAAPGASSPTVLPILPHASVSSLGTSLVAKAAPGNLNSFNCTAIAGATAGYCIAYNGTTAPSTGALTGTLVLDSCYFDTTPRGCSLAHINGSIAFSTGIVILMTSATTPFTYTTGTDTGFIEADTN